MLLRWLPIDYRRKRLLARTQPGPLHDYLNVPFPVRQRSCRDTPFVALDLETTGLDAHKDEILSIGLVAINGLQIELATAHHFQIRPQHTIPEQSAVIHQITDDHASQGEELHSVMARLLPLLRGKVLVAHHARFELGFLDQACRRLYGQPFLVEVVDTLTIEKQRRERTNRPFQPKELRLDAVRQEYNLPRYRAHNALSDALAAAELFIAQLSQMDSDNTLKLGRVLMQY